LFKDKPIIKFVTEVKGLDKIDDCIPKPATRFIPDWFKELPNYPNPKDPKTVKKCPSFPDLFSSAYVIPMWSDTILNYSKTTDQWRYESPTDVAEWTIHGRQQFLDFTEASLFGKEASIVFKAKCPWYLITPPGYSVLQLPMFYHFNNDWSVLPGIIDTDIHHEINQQVLYHGDDKDVYIPRGTPFVMYLPYKRENYDLVVSQINEKEKQIIQHNSLNFKTTEVQGGFYRELQRKTKKRKKSTSFWKGRFGAVKCPIK